MTINYKKNKVWIENLQIITQLGLTMVGCILFCFFIGRYIDIKLETKGIFSIIFIILGIVGGANTVYRQILEIIEPKNKKDKEDSNS
ncbi:MAG: AtpZ/AtpI family protein [Desulfobacterales bacterium]|nr:AtpZ/AtpI family protein [Desulfobacterales bacterium]